MATHALNWELQKVDFEPDGSLRDIYVLDCTLDDWRTALTLILSGPFDARLLRDHVETPLPTDIELLFARPGALLLFSVRGIELACHFFDVTEIELDFVPNGVTEEAVNGLLAFMSTIGRATGKQVVMTPENGRTTPIFRYDVVTNEVTWIPPDEVGRR